MEARLLGTTNKKTSERRANLARRRKRRRLLNQTWLQEQNGRSWSWLRENSEIDFANRNFVLTSINLKNKSAGDGCRDKTIEKTILRTFRARTFSRSLGQNRKSSTRANVFRSAPESGHCATQSACPFRAKRRHRG